MRTWLVGSLAALVVLLLAACAGPTPTPVPSTAGEKESPAKPAAAAQPPRGGKLVIGVLSSPRQLDPHKTASAEDHLVTFWLYNALTRITPDGQVVGDLATEWKPNDDLTKWTYKLRKGVLYHDGREMVAEDVVASYKRVLDKETASLGRSLITMIETMESPDPTTVIFNLNTPYAEFPKATATIQAKVAPRDQLTTLAQKPNGTGPFKLAEFIPGDRIRLVRNERYFIQGQPALDEVIYKVYPEALVATTALKRGEMDILYRVPPDQVKDLERTGGDLVVQGAPTNNWDAIFVHNKRTPFDDPKVRLALNLAVDKQKLVDTALFGLGTAVDAPIPPNSPVYAKDQPKFKQDVAKAKQLLAEAGYPNGIDLGTMFAPVGRPNRERLALAIQEQWQATGIRVKVERVPWDKFVADVELKADIYASGFGARATIDGNLYGWLHCNGSYNMFHYCNPELDRLLDAGRRARTLDEQRRIYGDVQRVLYENPPGVIAWVTNEYTAYRKTVQGYTFHPLFGVLYLDDVRQNK